MTPMLKFSVIVCTAFRPVLLQHCLESIVNQTFPLDRFEIIVINNSPNRDAETRAIIKNVKTPINIRYSSEEVIGLSPARNRGSTLATGEILVFIDDDAIADPNWLQGILSVYESKPDASVVGGKVNLLWETDIPKWLHLGLYCFLSELNYGDEIIQIQSNQTKQHLNGCNFSMRRSCFEDLGGFSHRLSRDPLTLISGDETEMFIRIQAYGGTCYYTPEALVYHLAPENRMNKQFFRKRAYWGGRSSAIIGTIHYSSQIFGILVQKIIHIPYYLLRSIWSQIINDPAQSFKYEVYSWLAIGYILEALKYFWVAHQLKKAGKIL
jgi:glucosyl-dolichyl phosphate glucuronosyltransferase